jgi:hypothetical protein
MRDPPDSLFGFTPVPLRARRDGWTPGRQADFIQHLRLGCSILEACRSVGMSSESAYCLYRRPGAESFRRAWDSALARPRLRPAPSTSATGRPETDGMCRTRRDHQLPAAPEKAPRPAPLHSLEAFARIARARRRPAVSPGSSTSRGDPAEED